VELEYDDSEVEALIQEVRQKDKLEAKVSSGFSGIVKKAKEGKPIKLKEYGQIVEVSS